MSAYKEVQTSFAIPGALESAKDEIQCLHDEMEEMEGNMSGTSAENTPKYEVVTEAQEQLSSAVSSLEYIDDEFEELLGKHHAEIVVYQSIPKRKRYNTSRAVRLENAFAIIDALIVAAREVHDSIDSKDDQEILQAGIDGLEASTDAQVVEFPGMFG